MRRGDRTLPPAGDLRASWTPSWAQTPACSASVRCATWGCRWNLSTPSAVRAARLVSDARSVRWTRAVRWYSEKAAENTSLDFVLPRLCRRWDCTVAPGRNRGRARKGESAGGIDIEVVWRRDSDASRRSRCNSLRPSLSRILPSLAWDTEPSMFLQNSVTRGLV